ncbi:MAG: methionine adenosyltransferase [Treponemataceae bacterium]
MKNNYLFTSESVSEGHPDKLCDQISDAILDAYLAQDSQSHVAAETFASTALVLVGGEVTSNVKVNVQDIARKVARDIGYTDADFGLDCNSMAVMDMIHSQSPDINQGVVGRGLKDFNGQQGAGDQGMMFGFACAETPQLMPAPIMFSHNILHRAANLRKNGTLGWLRPDSKAQVTIRYEDHIAQYIDTVVVSHQHNPDIEYEQIKDTLINQVVIPTLKDSNLLSDKTKYYINPTGRFVIGGPFGDTGLTGRKIIVDTYGGMGRHGGGAFSGKDPSKVDRSAAYMARYIAKHVVAAEFAERCEVQLAYAIGVPFPVSIMIDTFGTGKIESCVLEKAISQVFDCSPSGIIKTLDLKKPIYQQTARYGHFGREGFSWEKLDKIDELKKAIK